MLAANPKARASGAWNLEFIADCPMGADLEKAEKHSPPAPQPGLRRISLPIDIPKKENADDDPYREVGMDHKWRSEE